MMPDTIPPELQQFVEQELASGRYQSVEEVISHGIRLLRDRKLYELRKDVGAALEQLDRGEGLEIDDQQSLRAFFDDVKHRGRQRRQATKDGG